DLPSSLTGNLAFIQHVLSINLSELASALHVSRQSVYGWASGAAPHASNLNQIELLLNIARFWRTRSPRRLSEALRGRPQARADFLVLLAADPIDVQACKKQLERIFGEAATDIPRKDYRRLFAARGIPERTSDQRFRSIEEETGF
ncbi:MAG: hypothetical protein WA324_26325, partial [Bryobacteraceae bacterium]